MKKFCFMLLIGSILTSCNTTIGLGRDARDGFLWMKQKVEETEARKRQGSYDEYDAPVY